MNWLEPFKFFFATCRKVWVSFVVRLFWCGLARGLPVGLTHGYGMRTFHSDHFRLRREASSWICKFDEYFLSILCSSSLNSVAFPIPAFQTVPYWRVDHWEVYQSFGPPIKMYFFKKLNVCGLAQLLPYNFLKQSLQFLISNFGISI